MLLTGAQIIIETLKEEQVETVFGYPGGTVIPVYDALYQSRPAIKHVLTSHEQGAAHAADGYARSTGRTGVCLVTSGPGATNLVTGIATAYMDSVPMVAITINVSNSDLGKDSFQEVDIAGITMPVTKHNFIVKDISLLAQTIHRAFKIASSGRKGPVLVDITKDVTKAEYDHEPQPRTESECEAAFCGEGLDKAARMIEKAKKPLLLVGGGGASSTAAVEKLKALAGMLELPVAVTLMGKGVFNGKHPGYLGMAGLYGTAAAKKAFREADLLIAAGCRFSERVTGNDPDFVPNAQIIHIDIDNAELNKNILADVTLAGDIASIADELIQALAGKDTERSRARRRKWLEELTEVRKTEENEAAEKLARAVREKKLTGPAIVQTAYSVLGDDVIVSTEVGLNQMWAATHYRFTRPGQLLTSGGLGTMGYGLGAAIGAAIGNPGATVVNFAGDGCFRMNMNELLTSVREGLHIIEIVFDNSSLGMVHQLQKRYWNERYSETEFNDGADYAAIARSMGAEGCTVSNVDELTEALEKAALSSGTSVIVCRMDRDEVFDIKQ